MATLLPVVFVFVVIAALMTASALFTPKGPNQVYVRLAHVCPVCLLMFSPQCNPDWSDAYIRCMLLHMGYYLSGAAAPAYVYVAIHLTSSRRLRLL